MALEYAYRRCDDPKCSVFWIHADNEVTFLHDCKTIANKLGISEVLKDKELLYAVRSGIESRSQWVLVLDNADDLSLFGVGHSPDQTKLSLLDFIPKTNEGKVLWTSRDEQIAGALVSPRRGIQVSKMTSNEAKKLLLSIRNEISNTEEADTITLLEELHWFALAISQAGAYMRRMSMTVKEYLY